jgi:hypothetical protein
MKVVSFLSAITSINSPWDEVRPIAGRAIGVVTQAMRERYKFQASGQSAASQQVGLTTPNFATGQFQLGDSVIPINQFEFQPTAVVISCATTEQTYKVADDVFDYLAKTFGFRPPEKDRHRQFMTTIVVDFGPSGIPLSEKWTKVQSLMNGAFGKGAPLIPFGVRFASITAENQPQGDRQFVFERRATMPANSNWIYSQANLDTDTHLKLLTEMDAVLNG